MNVEGWMFGAAWALVKFVAQAVVHYSETPEGQAAVNKLADELEETPLDFTADTTEQRAMRRTSAGQGETFVPMSKRVTSGINEPGKTKTPVQKQE